MNERRRCQRMQSTRQLRARVHSGEPARILNLSPHGVLVETAVALRPGSDCDVALSLGGSGIHLRGSIRRCRATLDATGQELVYVAGLQFNRLNQNQQGNLEDLVAKLCLLSGEADRKQPGTGNSCKPTANP